MQQFTVFPNATAARTYRHANGTGGWIFEDDKSGESILFPPSLPPVAIFNHAMTRGRSGRLIGHA